MTIRRPLALVSLATMLSAGACKRQADAPLPRHALFPDTAAAGQTPRQTPAGVLPRVVELREREPDDTPGAAMTLPDDALVLGSIDERSPEGPKEQKGQKGQQEQKNQEKKQKTRPRRTIDVDWYRLPAGSEPGRISRIELRRAPACATLAVYRVADTRHPVATARRERRERPVIDGLSRDGGGLLVRVRCRGREAPSPPGAGYELALSTRPRGDDEEREPNEVPGPGTQELRLGRTLQGTLATRRDVDVFRLVLDGAAPGEAVALSVTGLPGVRMELSLLDPADHALLLRRRTARGQGVQVPNLDRGRSGDVLLLRLAALSGVAPDAPYAAAARLLLPEGCEAQARCPGRLPVEREPNDSRAAPMPISAGAVVTGVIDARDDVDWYTVDSDPGRVASVQLTPPDGLALELWVGDGPEPWAKIVTGATGRPISLPGWSLPTRRFFVRVAGAAGAFSRGRSYGLRVHLREQAPFEHELPGSAEPREPMVPVAGLWQMQGALVPAGDVDRFELDLSARGAPLRGELRCASDGAPGLACALLRDDGAVAATCDAPAVAGEVGAVPIQLPPGVYVVRVASVAPRDAPGTYRVEIADAGALAAALADPATPDAGPIGFPPTATPTFSP